LQLEEISEDKVQKIITLNNLAKDRNQSLAQMALAWVLKDKRITSVLIGASSVGQLNNNIDSLQNLVFSAAELTEIESILG
jgi:L-glyceraldehyde 3-phosphate reductase